MEQAPILNEHNKQEYPPMHTGGLSTPICFLHRVLFMVLAFVVIGCGSRESETDSYNFDEVLSEDCIDETEQYLSQSDTSDVWERYYTMSLDTVLNILSHTRYLTVNDYGWMGSPIEQWGCHIRMDSLCNNEMLVSLTKTHPAPVVRAMAFDILHNRRYNGCFQVLKDCLNDTATITWGDDVMSTESVASFRVSIMKIVNDGGCYTHFRMTPEQQQELDSILIFGENMGHIERQKWILDTLSPEHKYYSRIRSMYLDEGILESLPALARFRNEQDFVLIKEALSHYRDEGEGCDIACIGLKAVANWPDKRFWPMLKKIRTFVVYKHFTDADYSDLMRGCVNAAYYYFSPQAARYIRNFHRLTTGKMYVKEEYCYIFDGNKDVPECYKKMYNKWNK